MKQNLNGSAFEYALMNAFNQIAAIPIQENSSFRKAKICYENLDTLHQDILKKASLQAVRFLQSHDKRISQADSILLQDDATGIKGDVRDILIETPKNQIGISAKHNHTAIKHSRLSDKIDFGKVWADCPCSEKYFQTIQPVFSQLREMRAQRILFRDIQAKESRIYLPVLIAFEDELKRLCEIFREKFVERLFRYLLGKYDFYKIMLKSMGMKKIVSIQSVNINGTLEYGSKWKIPEKIHTIQRKRESFNIIEIIFEGGWTISFRLHNASTRAEPSLKFDIQFKGISSNAAYYNMDIVI